MKSANKAFAKAIVLSLVCLFCPGGKLLLAQPVFQRAIGMESFEKGSAFKLLPDNSFIIVGESESYGQNERDMLLMKTDSNGTVIWTKTFGGPERETVNDVLAVNGGYLFSAEKYQPNKQEGENLTLINTNATGDLKWKKIFDEGGNETEGFSMKQTPDGNFIIAGMVKKMNVVSSAFFTMRAEDQSAYLIKVDKNGNKLWSRAFIYGTENISSTATSVAVLKDGSYIVSGNVATVGKTDKKIEQPARQVNTSDVRKMLLMKVAANGNLVWAKEYAGNNVTMGYTVIEKQDGGMVLIGNTNTTATNIDIFLMSLDKDGNVQWSKTYGGPKFESAADVVQTPDGGFVVSGMAYSFGNGISDVLNFKTDANGNLQWAKTYGGQNEEYPSKLALTKSGIVTLGCTGSKGAESFDILLMKTDFNGNNACFAKDAKPTVTNFKTTMHKIETAKMEKVEQGVFPPNVPRPDVKNISEYRREVRSKDLCK
ncbi:MAG: PQQ-binding-like beta-propeller repeat protein [Chitinophagales bacterium]|nr:PQQ-binding-like beta-propeller repeat protein [Chitinophagales bacterium]